MLKKIPPQIKRLAAVTVIVGTLLLFYWYIRNHPEVLENLRSLNGWILIALTIGYALTIVVNTFVLHHSLLYVKNRVPVVENLLIVGYSSVVNFFGPLQSGPGFRAVYLKKKHGVRMRDFLAATLVFYLFFAIINMLIVGIAIIQRFGSVLVFVIGFAGLGVALLALRYGYKKIKMLRLLATTMKLGDRHFWLIGLWAAALVVVMCGIYFVELQTVSSVGLWEAVVYTAVANLALFVALTPGAIGFREAFLLFTQQLHGIDTTVIVGASVIDRAFYVLFLLVLFVFVLALGARRHLYRLRSKFGK